MLRVAMTAARHAADADRAAAAIARSRRVLVTGLVAADAAAAAAACDLAEACAAAYDPGCPETARTAGPIVARIGAVTADPGELRDRADLVVFWFLDPRRLPDGFIDRFVTPRVGDVDRRSLAVGPHDIPCPARGRRHLMVEAATAIDLARAAEAIIRGVPLDEAACPPPLAGAAREIAAAIAQAGCVAIVSDWSADATGLAAWSTVSLVRSLAHEKPAFELPLGDRDDAALAVATWRFGAAGAIERADRAGGRFLPAEADAVRLVDRREIDCLVIVGEPTAEVAAAAARAGDAIAIVRLPADAAGLRDVLAKVAPRKEGPA